MTLNESIDAWTAAYNAECDAHIAVFTAQIAVKEALKVKATATGVAIKAVIAMDRERLTHNQVLVTGEEELKERRQGEV